MHSAKSTSIVEAAIIVNDGQIFAAQGAHV